MQIAKIVLSFLQKNWKTILLIVAVIYFFFSIDSCNKKNDQIRDLQRVSRFNDSIANSKIKYYKDENGKLHAQVDNLYIDQLAVSDQLDSISDLLDIKSKQIEAFSKTGFKIDFKGIPDVMPVYEVVYAFDQDSITVANRYNFRWQDQWLQVSGSVGVGDSNLVQVTGTDTLNRVDYWKRKWFLGAKHYYSDFNNSNPHITLVGYKGVQFRTKEKKWSFGMALMYGYPVNNIQLNKPVIAFGGSLQYSLFRF